MLDRYNSTHSNTEPKNSKIFNLFQIWVFCPFWRPLRPHSSHFGLWQLPEHTLNICFDFVFISFFTVGTKSLTTGYKVHVGRRVAHYYFGCHLQRCSRCIARGKIIERKVKKKTDKLLIVLQRAAAFFPLHLLSSFSCQ